MQKKLHKLIIGWGMVEFLLMVLPLKHEISINALKGFSNLSAITVLNITPVNIKIILKISLKDLKFMLVLAMVGF